MLPQRQQQQALQPQQPEQLEHSLHASSSYGKDAAESVAEGETEDDKLAFLSRQLVYHNTFKTANKNNNNCNKNNDHCGCDETPHFAGSGSINSHSSTSLPLPLSLPAITLTPAETPATTPTASTTTIETTLGPPPSAPQTTTATATVVPIKTPTLPSAAAGSQQQQQQQQQLQKQQQHQLNNSKTANKKFVSNSAGISCCKFTNSSKTNNIPAATNSIITKNNDTPAISFRMRVKVSKRIWMRRRRSKRDSFPQPHEVTEGALQVWRTLPERIRQDPSLASFRQEHERLHGDEHPSADHLPTEDIDGSSAKDKNSNAFGQIGINVTNEMGQVRILDGRDVENNNEEHQDDLDHHSNSKARECLKWVKISILLVVWCVFTAFLMSTNEHVEEVKLISVPRNGSERVFPVTTATLGRLGLTLKGPFRLQEAEVVVNESAPYRPKPIMQVYVERTYYDASGLEMYSENVSQLWKLDLVYPEALDATQETKKTHIYDIAPTTANYSGHSNYTELNLYFVTNLESDFPVQLSIDESPIHKQDGVIYAALVLCGLYVMIIWEIVNRTFAAIIASTLSVGILAALNSRPSMATIMAWIDVETLLLLFGMMILVAILSETGVFDYLAVYAYKITNGHVWPLINCLCLFTALLSSFLDNVTTVLLMTPVTIRLCEVMSLNPVPILMCMVIYSNIGGALTPVGDPPNVIIASNNYISKNGVNFAVFTLHMLPGVALVMVQTYLQLRFKFRNIADLRFKDSPEVEELRHEIHVWKRAAASLSAYSKDEELVRETLMKKVNRLKRSLKKRMTAAIEPAPNYKQTLDQLQAKYPIRNKPLLIKCSAALIFVISLFFLHSVPELQRLSLGWTALLGAIFLIILADIEDMEAILARVEWSTLLFFAALFILMEALSELGLIEWIGNMTQSIILGVSEQSRLMVAVLIILWVSAIASAFVDNIPLTTMMVKITISLAQNSALNLPLQPLVWALAFGACLGGNGTLIGASANVVCAGVAEQHGYKFTFLQFFKVGFPVMIGSIVVSTAYLLLTHVVFSWH